MNPEEHELERCEAELRKLQPAKPPAAFLQRLTAAVPAVVAEHRAHAGVRAAAAGNGHISADEVRLSIGSGSTVATGNESPAARPEVTAAPWLSLLWRWLAPVAAVLVIGGLIWRANWSAPGPAANRTAMKADDVQIDEQLVSTFDAVAPLPSGEPVRFRCRQWMDEMVLRDSKQGIEVTRRVPRLQVVPVRYETY